MKIPPEKIEYSFGSYVRSAPECIPDLSIIQLVEMFKRSVAQRLVPLHPRDLLKIKPEEEKYRLGNGLFVSIKVDGESMVFIFNDEDSDEKSYFCNASAHRVYYGLPINKQLENLLRTKGIHHAIIPGELIASAENPPNFESRVNVADFLHFSRGIETTADLDRFGFRIFDVIEIDKENWMMKSYKDRYEKIKNLFPESGPIAIVRTNIMNDLQLANFYNQVVTVGGHEGIVIRYPENPQGYKIKPVHTIDVVLIGAVAGLEGSKIGTDQLASALMALRYADGTYQVLGSVGGGLTEDQRRELWQQLEFVPHTGFVGATVDGRAYQMVNPKIVAAIDYIDINTSTYNNQPILQNTLSFNPVTKTWEILRQLPFVSLVSPRFSVDHAIREDKINNVHDVRIEQITSITGIHPLEKVSKIDYPKAEILARYVFIKGDNVRKLIAWRTNKNQVDESYPGYVVAYTDYSTDRAEPLKREIKITNLEAQMWTILDDWIREEILDKTGSKLKRGWTTFTTKDVRPDPINIP
jgi:hypothetical protein